MNTERLNHLITIMEDVAERNAAFYMGSWAEPAYNKYEPTGDRTADPTTCNTAACALGWAARDPKCIADGLCMELVYNMSDHDEQKRMLLRSPADWKAALVVWKKAYDTSFYPNFCNERAFDAAVTYYDINYEQAQFLFEPGPYLRHSTKITPDDVIAHIKMVLAGHGAHASDDDDNDDGERITETVGFE